VSAVTSPRLLAFFQEWPPASSAVALRGSAIVGQLALLARSEGELQISVLTTTPAPAATAGVAVRWLAVPTVEHAAGLHRRVIGEVRIGLALMRALRSGRAGCDLLVVSTPSYIAALFVTAVARQRGINYVLDVRDLYPQVYAEAGLLRRRSWVYRLFAAGSRAMYRGAAQVIAATRGLERAIRTEAPTARVSCAYNGYPDALAQRSAAKHARFTACFHGVLGFFQDVETLVEVARRVHDAAVDIVVIGSGRKEELLQRDPPPNLRFLGRMSFDDTIAELERCHVGLCLRLDDGISRDAFPVKVWECLGLGMPALVTPPCEAGAFLHAEGCGMQFAAGDVDAIAGALIALSGDAEHLEALSSRCREVRAGYARSRMGREAAQLIVEAWRRA
jgi:glycosyltransferase involved in cell wall biosynthesis